MTLLDDIRAKKPELLAIAAKHGIGNLRIFGSVARGEANENSDVDLLADLSQSVGWGFVTAKREMSELLSIPVDIVDDQYIDKYLEPYIRAEAIPL